MHDQRSSTNKEACSISTEENRATVRRYIEELWSDGKLEVFSVRLRVPGSRNLRPSVFYLRSSVVRAHA